jgi:Site-specific recombinases, DNA invertase Pin homologs
MLPTKKGGETVKKITKINPINQQSKKKIRVAAYARVSTSSDEQLLSLENQKLHYENRIESTPDWELVEIYFDEGISGTKLDRRNGLKQLIKDCELGKIDFILTKSISRFSRNAIDCLKLVRNLMELNIFIEFEKENINTKTMDGELMLSILSSLAESESKSSSQNIQWAIEKRFQDGTFKISYPPYGYDWLDGKMVINEEQAIVVRDIFLVLLSGMSTNTIAKKLNEQNVPTKRGRIWHATTVRGIIRNEKYKGHTMFGKTFTDTDFKRKVNRGEKNQYFMENHHQAIIDEQVFNQAQLMIAQNAKSKNVTSNEKKYQNRYAFSGIVKCRECGGSFKRRIQNKNKNETYIAWACANHLNDVNSCSMKFIRDEQVKATFITMMNKLIFSRERMLKPLLHEVKKQTYKTGDSEVSELDLQVEIINQQLKNLAKFMSSGYIEQATYLIERNELVKELQEIERQKLTMENLVSDEFDCLESLEELMKFTGQSKSVESYEEELFTKFVKEVTVISRNELMFKLRCGLSLKERMN